MVQERIPRRTTAIRSDEIEQKDGPRDEAAETRKPNLYTYPTLQKTFEANSQEEADRMAEDFIKQRDSE